MAKTAYVGIPEFQNTSGDKIPKAWTAVTAGTEYVASDGTRVMASGCSYSGYSADKACDSNTSTYWSCTGQVVWYTIQFPQPIRITRLKLMYGDAVDQTSNLTYFKIQVSNDNVNWLDVYDTTSYCYSLTQIDIAPPGLYTYYRFTSSRHAGYGNAFEIYEIQTVNYATTVVANSGTANKITKAYAGVANVARKIKKGYIGVDGIARQFFSAQQVLSKYGQLSSGLYYPSRCLAATSVGDYALFGGGQRSADYDSKTVTAFNGSLVRSVLSDLQQESVNLTAANNHNYALFGGGDGGAKVTAYDTNKVKTNATDLTEAREDVTGSSTGSFALFGGGRQTNGARITTVEAYADTLVRSTTTMSKVSESCGGHLGNYGFFAGGNTSSSTSGSTTTIQVFNNALTRVSSLSLTISSAHVKSANAGGYIIFGGGIRTGYYDVANTTAFNQNLVKSTPASLDIARSLHAAASAGTFALFACGNDDDNDRTNKVDIYDENLVHSSDTAPISCEELAGASAGNYALFGGGYGSSRLSAVWGFQAI